jgi:ArsR family transcriptional regulator
MKTREAKATARLLKAVSHPTRVLILAELLQGTRCVNRISHLLKRPQPNISQHLMALRKSGLVACYREGVSRCYYLAEPDLVRGLLDLAGPRPRTGARPKAPRSQGTHPARKAKPPAGRDARRRRRQSPAGDMP